MDTASRKTPGRNDPCRCGSGKKYKQCCLDTDEAAARATRAKEAAAPSPDKPAATEATDTPHAGPKPRPKPQASQTWKRGVANTRGFQRTTATRKVGGGG